MERFKNTYAKKKTLLGLALDICESTSEVSECKSEVNEVFKQYLYQREGQAGKFPLEFQ